MGDLTMGAAFTSGPRPVGRYIGPSVRVDRTGQNTYRIVSTPHPIHWGAVRRTHIIPGWVATVETAKVTRRHFRPEQLREALQHVASHVGALYRLDMRTRFTGAQRFVMGRNLCPARVPCPLPDGCPRADTPGHYHLCKQVPDNGSTVYCDRHTPAPERPGDAFHALDESGGD